MEEANLQHNETQQNSTPFCIPWGTQQLNGEMPANQQSLAEWTMGLNVECLS